MSNEVYGDGKYMGVYGDRQIIHRYMGRLCPNLFP